jgi:hypothetical protein
MAERDWVASGPWVALHAGRRTLVAFLRGRVRINRTDRRIFGITVAPTSATVAAASVESDAEASLTVLRLLIAVSGNEGLIDEMASCGVWFADLFERGLVERVAADGGRVHPSREAIDLVLDALAAASEGGESRG